MWPHAEATLHWIDRYGDGDGDGFVEYQRQAANGLVHQGWKDTSTAIFHADGALAPCANALCEVQEYVYAAQRAGAALTTAWGRTDRAAELTHQAEALRERFERAFWCEELSTYALALDGDKQPCRVQTSNAGQCLFTGIASPEHARQVARTLLAPASFVSGTLFAPLHTLLHQDVTSPTRLACCDILRTMQSRAQCLLS